MSLSVVALGGNALGNTPAEQEKATERVAKTVVELLEAGTDVVLTHGNGPQVGMIHLAFEAGASSGKNIAQMPLAEATAMSEGYIGYHLQKALLTELARRGLDRGVASLVTQVEVDADDSAFSEPTKPIGSFLSEVEAVRFCAEHPGAVVREDAGRGYRRMVASPRPRHILGIEEIRALLEAGSIVIACGGGGIPVMRTPDGGLAGVEAVIDKDLTAAKLAEELNADALFILTAVERVVLNFGTSEEQPLDHISANEAKRYAKEGHFAPGSMLPKVEAAVAFAEGRPGRRAVIAALGKAAEALRGRSGTVIEAEPAPIPG